MEENRSFDNLLGGLYARGEVPRGQRFEGVVGRNLALPIPPGADAHGHSQVDLRPTTEMHTPTPDPGEEWGHVNVQLYGRFLPHENSEVPSARMLAPYNLPDPLPSPAPMDGFVLDYYHTYRTLTGTVPGFAQYREIMQYFPADALPVVSTLARRFAVFDHFFAGVPSQTFPNRSFFHAAQSSGWVNNDPYANWLNRKSNHAETVFDQLDRRGLEWAVYWDLDEKVPLTALLHHARLWGRLHRNFRNMAEFYRDVEAGTLPAYSFIEPRFLINSNDMHPPIRALGKVWHSSVLAGEVLVAQIYEAIRRSGSRDGSNRNNTAFLLTFDEHGGNFDHVPPPAAVPPDRSRPAGQFGFRFDRLGLRVPMIVVSAYTEAGTIVNDSLDSTSFLKTLETRWGLSPLTERDRHAGDLGAAFNRAAPRDLDSWPQLTPREVPVEDTEVQELTPLGMEKLRLVAGTLALSALDDAVAVRTVGEAKSFLQSRLRRLF